MRFTRTNAGVDFKFIVLTVSSLALVLGLWITSAELIRPSWEVQDGKVSASTFEKSRARIAATIGVVRSDLWAEDALIRPGFDPATGAQSPADGSDRIAALAAAQRALLFAPVNPRLWLLLAAANPASRPDGADDAASALEMAYLTGQQEARLLPARLLIAARSSALSDLAIQDFVQSDVNLIFTKLPNLKPALQMAYRASTAENRAVLDRIISSASPGFLQSKDDTPGRPDH